MCILFHNYGPYTKPVDTGATLYLAQFRSCLDCHKIQVRFIKLIKNGSECRVLSKDANEALDKTKSIEFPELI